MSSRVSFLAAAAVVLGCCLWTSPSGAEGMPDPRATETADGSSARSLPPRSPEHFGLEQQYTTFGIGAFTAQSTAMEHGYKNSGYIYPSATSILEWIAELGPATGVPVGATVIQVCAYVFDSSAAKAANLSVGAYEFGSASDNPGYTAAGVATSGLLDTPGYTAICVSPADLVVRSYTDFAGDATEFYGYHRVGIQMDGTDSEIAFGGVLVRWQRQLSPAPGAATFGDVPTGYWAFAHVEALVDSGITAGCGGGDYCPDSPVTRAEMAVFLAKALGLFWPY